ncbi:MAG: nucleotidyltransferase family protein [Anaerolineales bacterium]
MRPEDRVLFACVRQDFSQEYQQAVRLLNRNHALSWELIFSKAERHGVASLVYVNLCQRSELQLDIPQQVVERYRLYTMQNAVRKEQRAQKLVEVLDCLTSYEIEAMLIKGGALDLLVYDHPAFSTLNDIDLVLRRRREDFTQSEMDDIMHDLHGSGVEYDFYEHHDMTINGALPVDFDLVWGEAKIIQYRDRDIWILSPEDMIISLCINSCRKRYFRLKSLMDIAETTHKIRGLRWDIVAEKARRYDCSSIVYTALLVADRTVGCTLPETILDNLSVSPVRAALIKGLVDYALRFSPLPLDPISGTSVGGRQIHASLVLPYASYRLYQIRHKLFEEIL